MTWARRAVWRRRGCDRGTALVEASLILPVIILFVGGIFELGFMFRSASVVTSSARSGARLAAATYARATDRAAALDEIRLTVEKDLLSGRSANDTPVLLWVYRVDPASTTGQPQDSTNFNSCTTNCVRWSWNGSAFTLDSGSSWPSPDACGQTVDEVGVLLKVDHSPVVFTLFGSKRLTEYTVMRLEPRDNCTTPE